MNQALANACLRFARAKGLVLGRSLALGLALGLTLGLAAGTLSGCGKADRGKCEQMCRNYATVSFRDVEAARLPPDKREAALADKIHRGLEFCINKCQGANNDDQITCWTAAKNMSELKACE